VGEWVRGVGHRARDSNLDRGSRRHTVGVSPRFPDYGTLSRSLSLHVLWGSVTTRSRPPRQMGRRQRRPQAPRRHPQQKVRRRHLQRRRLGNCVGGSNGTPGLPAVALSKMFVGATFSAPPSSANRSAAAAVPCVSSLFPLFPFLSLCAQLFSLSSSSLDSALFGHVLFSYTHARVALLSFALCIRPLSCPR